MHIVWTAVMLVTCLPQGQVLMLIINAQYCSLGMKFIKL